MSKISTQANSRVFYGWVVVAAAFTISFMGFGSAYAFGVFAGPLQKAFTASRGSVSLIFSWAGFLYFVFGMVAGPLADRWGSRRLALIGMVLAGAGMAVASMAQTLVEVYASYGLGLGLGIGCSYVPALGAVQRWFSRRRGLASGLAVSGIGVGTLAMPPLASLFIETLGWRAAYLILGCLVAVVGGAMAMLIKNDPHHRGLEADGDIPRASAQPVQEPGVSVRQAVRSRRFVGLYAACVMCSFGLFVPYVHIIPYALDHGISKTSAVLLLSVMGVGSTLGRVLLGGIADRVGRRYSFEVMILGMAAAFAVWAFSTAFWQLAIFALIYGAFSGGFVALLPPLVTDYFGGQNISGILGILFTSMAFGTLFGPSTAGFVFDLAHSYTLPILAGISANLLAAGIAAGSSKTPIVEKAPFVDPHRENRMWCSYPQGSGVSPCNRS